MSNKFVEIVRQSKVKQPTQRNFSEKKWREIFDAISNASEQDQRLYNSGLWFFHQLERIRRQLAESPNEPTTKDRTIMLYVGFLNGFQSSTSQISTLVKKFTLGDKIHMAADIDSIAMTSSTIEAVVDAIKHPMAQVMHNKNTNKKFKPIHFPVVKDFIGTTFSLGYQYTMLEHLWMKCIWGNWYVDIQEKTTTIRPSDHAIEENYAVSRYRRDSLLGEMARGFVLNWANLSMPEKTNLCSIPHVDSVSIKKHPHTFNVSCSATDIDTMPFQIANISAANELYFEDLLADPLPNFQDVRIHDILYVWSFLSSLAQKFIEKLPSYESIKSTKNLFDLCPIFSVSDLVRQIKKNFRVSKQQASAIIDVFTFKGSHRDDIWLKPIIPIGNGLVTFVLLSINHPNLLRSIDQWMKDGGLAIDQKGPAFEAFVRDRMNYQGKTNLSVYPHQLVLNSNDTREEIDVIGNFGNTILVAEVKCTIHPVSPLEYYNYQLILQEAAHQISRKSKFVRENITSLLDITHWDVDANNLNIVPAIITNLPLGVGHNQKDIPVVDLNILRLYFEKGIIELYVVASPDGNKEVHKTKTLYNNLIEAEKNLYQYLISPPHLQLMRQYIEFTPISLLVNSQEQVEYIYPRLRTPEKFE